MRTVTLLEEQEVRMLIEALDFLLINKSLSDADAEPIEDLSDKLRGIKQ